VVNICSSTDRCSIYPLVTIPVLAVTIPTSINPDSRWPELLIVVLLIVVMLPVTAPTVPTVATPVMFKLPVKSALPLA